MKTSLKTLAPLLAIASWPTYALDQKECEKDMKKEVCVELQMLTDPIICYVSAPKIDKEITVGAGVELCSGSTNWKKTIACYNTAWTELKLNRGQSVALCKGN